MKMRHRSSQERMKSDDEQQHGNTCKVKMVNDNAPNGFSVVTPECLEPFKHQVGGHTGLLMWSAHTVCKPFTVREHAFYISASDSLRPFMPLFKGILDVRFEATNGDLNLIAIQEKCSDVIEAKKLFKSSESSMSHSASTSRFIMKCSQSQADERMELSSHIDIETSDSENDPIFLIDDEQVMYKQNPWSIRCQTRFIEKMLTSNNNQSFVMLENLCHAMKRPCILDVKMGVQQHGDHAPPHKVIVQTQKCQKSTSAKMGCRLVGMQIYDARDAVFRCVNKYRGRQLDAIGLAANLRLFVQGRCGRSAQQALIDSILSRLYRLRAVLTKADGYRFYSSSLLLIYDSVHDESQAEFVDVRMIDFEHSTFAGYLNDPMHQGVDEGYILGLTTLIRLYTEIRDNLQT